MTTQPNQTDDPTIGQSFVEKLVALLNAREAREHGGSMAGVNAAKEALALEVDELVKFCANTSDLHQ